MSAVGPAIVGAVAQSQVQSQQISRAQHRHQNDNAQDLRRVRDMLNLHFQALDEGDDDTGHLAELHIDDQMPEQGGQQQAGERHSHPRRANAAEPQADAIAAPPSRDAVSEPAAKPDALYRHVDLTA